MKKTREFDKWLKKLKDGTARAKILFRLQRLESGALGDVKKISHGINELSIHYGNGYRVYYKLVEEHIVLLLIAGSKNTQKKDIEKAKSIWDNYKRLS